MQSRKNIMKPNKNLENSFNGFFWQRGFPYHAVLLAIIDPIGSKE